MTESIKIYQMNDLSKVEREIRLARKKVLRESLGNVLTLYINTGKASKALAIIELIANLTGENLVLDEGVELIIDKHDEPAYTTADAVAIAKAKRAQVQVVEKRGFLLMGEDVYVGSDVNAFTHNQAGVAKQQHKLERNNKEISVVQFIKIREQLIQQYCHPRDGRVKVIWDLATHVINSKSYTFSDDIEVISSPVDQELLEMYLLEAWMRGNSNGLMMKSNLHFAAMECLIENGKIHSIAILPEELKRQGYSYQELRQGPTPDILAVALYSIITNRPPALVGEVPSL